MERNKRIWQNKIRDFLLRNLFPLFGLGALIWFLIRVIPKPSRAGYPCMKVAAPMASGFVLWILGLSATLFSFKGFRKAFINDSYVKMIIFLLVMVTSLIFTFNQSSSVSIASVAEGFDEIVIPNNPIGVAKGINPGRVVWVWDPDATNENCENIYYGDIYTPADDKDDGWFLSKNNNQDAIDNMLSSGLMKLTGEASEEEAWTAIFTHFNEIKHGSSIGYSDGENIFIKINATSTYGKGSIWGGITDEYDHNRNDIYGTAETSPHLILALLRQLVNNCNIPQENISVGDPMKLIYNNSYDLWYNEFPEVNYISNDGGNGREQVVQTESDVIHYSDQGNEMTAAIKDKIYTVMNDTDYLINVPALKAHSFAGITLFAKNHFGSITRDGAQHLHPGLVSTNVGVAERTEDNIYRVQVDLMAHEKFGGNQVLFLLDALWAGSDAIDPPTKWDMNPFNGDWTSSIFLSQDPVAIESVAFDFLFAEYDGSYSKVNYPHMKGTTDYLRQAASSDYWPEGVIYDPENDGTSIASLGVNEHWNNSVDKEYSRNLGVGEGIELVFINNSLKILEAPSLLAATIFNDTDVELNWLDNAENEDGYIIERRENREGADFKAIDTVAANITNYLDNSEKTYSSYEYRIFAFNSAMNSEYSSTIIVDVIVGLNENINSVNEYRLYQNYPNPFNPITHISYVLRNRTSVKLEVYDLNGSLVKTLFEGYKDAGVHNAEWNGLNNMDQTVSSGNYFYRLWINDGTNRILKSKKMTFLK